MSGYLDNGQWREGWYDTAATKGEFVRSRAAFRDWISADGASGFPAAAGRYHLYVSLACPWAHRTLIVRALKKLEDAIAVSVVAWLIERTGSAMVPAWYMLATTIAAIVGVVGLMPHPELARERTLSEAST